MLPDKLNSVDYHWFLVCTKPGHEPELCALIEREKGKIRNILEVYCPTHTKVYVRRGDNEQRQPFFDGYVFVLATQGALAEFLRDNDSGAYIWYNRKRTPDEKAVVCTVPESQMRAFRDYNENYADKVIVLERPYTDYAINAKTDEPNEIVRVVDGPLAGCEGYICRFHKKKGLVFRVQGIMPGSWLTVTYPNASDLHVVRLHNAEGDRLSIGTEKERAVDLLVGILQGCGYGERTQAMLYGLMERLAADLSLEALCKHLQKQGEKALTDRLAKLTTQEAELLINLARYEHDTPGYVKENWPRITLRPFLTPTLGIEMEEGKNEVELQHKDFTEIIRRVDITEEVYYPSRQEDGKITTAYYAHIGRMEDKSGFIYFANWDDFLRGYFLTAGKANEKLVSGKVQKVRNGITLTETEKLIESFRNYAPTLYKVLTDADSAVKAVPNFKVGENTMNVLAIQSSAQDKEAAKDQLVKTCVRVCTEINTTNHLAVWRRYLRTVWLHN
ncbi:transcription termination/antitermination NusG family protein [uncultured Phocaeicola sp.]|uniref:transcription termination/antitermination NusG family protein n=1 Tax=uncultured Phocaeicola sp. TaxID=990718 RepID=UPI0025CD1514|nr:transcription termination/antitermination NusG family protein [uncultured Phocaeicola sp.]